MKKKILILVASRGRGGVEKRFINYALYLSNLKDEKLDYTFLVNRRILLKEELNILRKSRNIKLITYSGYRFPLSIKIDRFINRFTFYIKAKSINKKYSFDLTHFVTFTTINAYDIFKNSAHLISVYTGFEKTQKIIINHTLFQKTIHKAHYDCLSPLIADLLKKSTSLDDDHIHTTPGSFIDLSNTDNNIDNKENSIVFLGRLRDQKGLDLLLSLIANWRSIKPGYTFHIFGKGKAKKRIKTLIKNNNLSDKIHLSYTKNPKYHLRKSKIFLSLQKGENYPSQSLLEAMACKNAVVATDVGLTHKLVDDSNGIRINNNTESLVSGINMLINKIENDNSLFESSRKKILDNHSVEQFHEYLSAIYNKI